MKKTVLTVLMSLCIILGIMIADYTINSNFIMVKTSVVSEKSMEEYIKASGICLEQNKRELRVDMPFLVENMYVSVGDTITKGQKLMEVNKESLKTKIELQSVTVSSVNNDSLLAKINNYNTAVTSPIDGVVTKITVAEGDLINTQLPVMIISDLENLMISASVPENLIKDVYIGQTVYIETNNPGSKINGKVTDIHPVRERDDINSSVSIVKVDIMAENYKDINPQSSLSLEFVKKTDKLSVIIPFDSVMFDEDKPYVFLNNSGYAVKRYIELGEEYDIDVEVKKGIIKGDNIVVNPKVEKIKEGDKLLVVNEVK